MTVSQVGELIRDRVSGVLSVTNAHGIDLNQAMVPPREISVIVRQGAAGERDEVLSVWLIGQEPGDGSRIIMSCDGLQFGLAAKGFSSDEHPIFIGWYGDLLSAFQSM